MDWLTFTKEACEQLTAQRIRLQVSDDHFVRVGIQGQKGCAGFSYLIGFDREREGDRRYVCSEITVIIAREHSMYVGGLTIGYARTPGGEGFVFHDPSDRTPSDTNGSEKS